MDQPRRRAAIALTGIGLGAALLLAGVDRLTRERIEDAQQRRALSTLSAMLPTGRFDNDLLDDAIDLPIPGLEQPGRLYRARRDGEPVGLLVDLVTHRGYSGDIRLLVAVNPDQTVLAVRVLEHRETPGLGDKIEIERSDWITGFAGRSLGDPPAQRWAPDQRGGDFDTLTSATITTDAVVDAVRSALVALAQADEEQLWGAAQTPFATP
ncbi:MAG: RnfABCDGE type electron transport complex subunit G [Wenzhouxiangella sp.]